MGMPVLFSQVNFNRYAGMLIGGTSVGQHPAPIRRSDPLTKGLTDYGSPQYNYGGELIACGRRFPPLLIAAIRI